MRESQLLDVKEVMLTQQAVEVDAQGMSSQLAVQTSTQPPEGMSMIALHTELLNQLAVDCLDDLPHTCDARGHPRRQLLPLVSTRYAHQAQAIAFKKSIGHRLRNVAFVRYCHQVGVFLQKVISTLQVRDIGWDQLEIQYHPSQRDEQLHLVAEESEILGRYSTKGSAVLSPLPCSLRSQVKLHHRYWQAVNAALPIPGYIQHPEHHLSDQVKGVHELPSSSVEAALRRNVRKQVAVVVPLRKEGQLRVPPLTLSNQAHRYQLLVRAARRRTRTREQMANLSVSIFHDAVHPQTKVVEVGYH